MPTALVYNDDSMPQKKNKALEEYTSLYSTELINDYSVNSGALAVIDENLDMEMNEYGQYNYVLKESAPKRSPYNDTLLRTSAMSDESPNEDELSKELFADIPDIKYQDIVGYYLDTYAGHVVEGDYREKASSGGFATWLLVKLYEKGLIDGVIHFKETNDGDGILFKYAVSETIEEIRDGAKSRYYPGEFSGAIKDIKKKNGSYAIVGIPSFITEVRLLAKQDPEVAKRIKYTFGLICGHQKSAKYAEALAWEHGIKPGNLKRIDFRKKLPNEPANKYITEFTGLIDGKEVNFTKDQSELYVSNWGHGFFKSKFSDFTDDTLNETADISLGDAWLPEYASDGGGNNVLIVRNEDIRNIIEAGIKDEKIAADHVSPETVIKSQSGLVHHTHDELPYRLWKKDTLHMWRPQKRLFASRRFVYSRRLVQDVRESIAQDGHLHYRYAVNINDWSYFTRKVKRRIIQYSVVYAMIRLRKKTPTEILNKILQRLKR